MEQTFCAHRRKRLNSNILAKRNAIVSARVSACFPSESFGTFMATLPRNFRSPNQIACDAARHERDSQRAMESQQKGEMQRAAGSQWSKARAGYLRSHSICVECEARGRTEAATHIKHIKPIGEDWDIFWNSDNWRAVCRSCFNGQKTEGRRLGFEFGLERDAHQRANDRRRGTAAERGYNAEWQKARASFLIANPTCVRCESEGRYEAATVVDHIIPHRGNQTLFWDINNWQPLCEHCHNSWKKAQEMSERY